MGRTEGESELSVWIRELSERKVVSSDVERFVASAYLHNASVIP